MNLLYKPQRPTIAIESNGIHPDFQKLKYEATLIRKKNKLDLYEVVDDNNHKHLFSLGVLKKYFGIV